MRKAWDHKVPGSCINLTASWYANAAFSIVTDFIILLLPTPAISSLQLPRKTKIGLIAVFSVGIFVCVTSILRMMTLDVATKSPDPTCKCVPHALEIARLTYL